MEKLLRFFLISLGLIFVILFIFLLYQRNEEFEMYKNKAINNEKEYLKLKTSHDDLLKKTKGNRTLTILTGSSGSKNILIGDIIYNYSQKVNGDLSIYYKNLTTGESVIIDGDKKYYMASLYKVILTLYILDGVKNKQISLDDKVGNPQISMEDALDKIITESNNEYAQLLALKYGWENIEEVMKEKLGIDFNFDSNLEANVKNIGFLFEEIALSLRVPDSESNYLLKLLNNQKRISKLPKYLPKNIYSHNKTGEFDGYSHDAAIFYTPKANYILVFMSKTSIPGDTNEKMALMSKEIYEQLNK